MKTTRMKLLTPFLAICLAVLILPMVTGCNSIKNPGKEFADATSSPMGFYPQGGPSSKRSAKTSSVTIEPTGRQVETIVVFREYTDKTGTDPATGLSVITRPVTVLSGIAFGDPTSNGQAVKMPDGTFKVVSPNDIVGTKEKVIAEGNIEIKGGRMEIWSASILEPLTVQKNPGLLSTIATGLFDFGKDAVLFKYLSGGSDKVLREVAAPEGD